MKYFLHGNDIPASVEIGESVAIDTETTGLNLVRDRLCLIQMCTGNEEAHLIQVNPSKHEAPNFVKILKNKDILKIFHFARFDIAVLLKHFEIDIFPVYCTKIASKVARTSSNKHGLKDLVQDFLSVEIFKLEQTSDWGKKDLTKSQLRYAASDVLYLHQLKKHLDKLLVREGRMGTAQNLFDFLPRLASLDLQGWDFNEILSH